MTTPTEQLINEVRVFYQALVQIGSEIHRDSGISMGMRAILEYLNRNGDSTVPHMARERRVTRQRIQTLVNSLLSKGFVESMPNPASKRSPLISLTIMGTEKITEMRRLEGRELAFGADEEKIKDATTTLKQLRTSVEEGRQ